MAPVFCNNTQNAETLSPDRHPDLKYCTDKFATLATEMTIERE